MKNIIETAIANPDFSTLVTAIKAAGLVEKLSEEGPFTVFAPTNAAFAEVPEATLKTLLADKAKLTQILTYHVIAGTLMSKEIASMTEAETVEGSAVHISVESDIAVTEVATPEVAAVEIDAQDGIMINEANITKADIACTNGVIHVIDKVLMP